MSIDYYGKKILAIEFNTSLIAFHVDALSCEPSRTQENRGIRLAVVDFRHNSGGLKSAQNIIERFQKIRLLNALVSNSALSKTAVSFVRKLAQRREVKNVIAGYAKENKLKD